MSESDSEPLQRWHVGAIVATVVMTLGGGSFIYTLRADVDRLQSEAVTKAELAAAVNAQDNKLERILGVLCDDTANTAKRACQ